MDTENLQTIPPSDTVVKKYKSKEVEVLKDGRNLARRTAVINQWGSDLVRGSQQVSSEEKEEARDPDLGGRLAQLGSHG